MILHTKKRYLQISFNTDLSSAYRVISLLPANDRIIIEAGTPLIKQYGMHAVASLHAAWRDRLVSGGVLEEPYIVADMKCIDRGETEVAMAKRAGASAVVVMGSAPVETINRFIASCEEYQVDSYIDMMNVQKPYQTLRALKKLPTVSLLHRGVDEEEEGKMLPIHLINKVKGAFNILVGVAGGDTLRELQSAVFNGADVVVVWKSVADGTDEDVIKLVNGFFTQVK